MTAVRLTGAVDMVVAEMELPYRSKGGVDDEASAGDDLDDKEDPTVDNRLYNGYQGSLMEPNDNNISEDVAGAGASATAGGGGGLPFSRSLCLVVACSYLRRLL